MKKIFRKLCCLLLVLAMLPLAGCQNTKKYDQSVVEKFTAALEQQDFAAAHNFFWKHASYESLETFTEECAYLVDTLQVKKISIQNVQVTQDGEKYLLKYTCVLDSGIAGEISSDLSTHLILQERSTYVEYSHELLLGGFEHGCTISKTSLTGQRGEILTADGKVVAENNYADSVCIRVSEDLNITELLSDVDAVLDLSEKELAKAKKSFDSALKNNYGTSVIKTYSRNTVDATTESLLTAINGVYLDRSGVTPQRYYPYENIYFHTVGYAGSPNNEQTQYIEENGYSTSSVYGKEGLESAYNDALMGKDGYRIAIRSENGSILRTLYEETQQDGETLRLTIDSSLQETAYYAMVNYLSENQSGAAITLDPTTGAIKSFVSYPTVNANLFSSSISQEEYDALTAKENGLPLYNRLTLGLYPPGSVLKPFIGAYALDEGTITENTVFPYAISGNKWIPEDWHWPPITRNSDSGTPLVLKNAISNSDNIFFAWVGLKLGSDKLCAYLEQLGFGQKQPFELPTSTSNLMHEKTEMSPVLLTDMSIGHGELLCTPVQIAALYTAFSNNGDVLTPYLTSSGERTVQQEQIFSSSALEKLLPGLREAATSGTARSANVKDMTLYAKTGTAIKSENSEERISWICIWGDYQGESVLTVVMIDGPNGEDTVKFKVAKSILQSFHDSISTGNDVE